MTVGVTYRLTLVYRASGREQVAVNNLFFRQEDELIFDTAGEDLAQRFLAQVWPNGLNGAVTNQLGLVKLSVAAAPLFLTEYEEFHTDLTGGGTGDSLPAIVAGCLNFRTANLTRRGRGRMFIPSPPESYNGTNGAPNSAWLNQMDLLSTSLANMSEINVNYARWQHMIWSVSDQTARVVTSYVAKVGWSRQADRIGLI